MSRQVGECTIGMLYCGDLGAALAHILNDAGYRVVTTCAGRSPATRTRAEAVDVEILPSLDDVVSCADVAISLVSPGAAKSVARQYALRRHLRPSDSLFIDANSLSLQDLATIEAMFAEAGIPFVDAAIHGGARTIEQAGVIYLSGPHAEEARPVFTASMRAELLGHKIGQATRMKLLMAGLSKSLNVLFLEIAILAHRAEMSDQFLEESKTFYPGLMTAIDRMLPTYPQHAARRVTELQNIEELARSSAAPHEIVQSARGLLETLAGTWQAGPQSPALDIPQIVAHAANVTTITQTV